MKQFTRTCLMLAFTFGLGATAKASSVTYNTLASMGAGIDSVTYSCLDTLVVLVKPSSATWEAVDSSLESASQLAWFNVVTEWQSNSRLYRVAPVAQFDSLLAELGQNGNLLLSNPVLEWQSGGILLLSDEISVHSTVPASDSRLDSVYGYLGLEVLSYDTVDNTYAFLKKVTRDGHDLVSTAENLLATGFFEYCQPDFVQIGGLASIPNDPLFAGYQWHLRDTELGDEDDDIDADSAWDITRGSPNLSIVHVDVGFQFSHPDFPAEPTLYYQFDAAGHEWTLDSDFDGDAVNACSGSDGLCYHGMATVGMTFARWNNGTGIAGLTPDCRLTPVKIFADLAPPTLPPGALRPADWVRALQWILQRKRAYNPNSQVNNVRIAVVSISVNGGAHSDATRWFDSLYANGILCVVSAGNNGSIAFPAYLESVRCVNALMSNSAPGTILGIGAEGQAMDYSAPGIGITTLDLVGSAGQSSWSDYTEELNGTSFSSPLVAGVAALVYSRRPDLIPQTGPPTAIIAVLDSSATGGPDALFASGLAQHSLRPRKTRINSVEVSGRVALTRFMRRGSLRPTPNANTFNLGTLNSDWGTLSNPAVLRKP